MTVELVLVVVVGIIMSAQLIVLLLPFKALRKELDSIPKVSILLAVRDEEVAIADCMTCLLEQDYGVENMEIIVGDDASSDGTLTIAKTIQSNHDSVRVIEIKEQVGSSIGKANVLTQLSDFATGEFLLITDADTRPNPSWVRGIVSTMKGSGTDLLVGVTKVTCRNFMDRLQNLEWIMILSILKKVSDFGIPVTGLGSNMAVRKHSYNLTGGYRDLPGSITEDFALVERFRKKKLSIHNSFEPEVLADTDGVASFTELLNQRKRWMRGAFMQPLAQVIFLVLFSLFPALIVVIAFFNWYTALLLFAGQLLLVQLVIIQAKVRIGEKYNLPLGLVFEVFRQFFWLVSLLYYILPTKIEWKGRHYK